MDDFKEKNPSLTIPHQIKRNTIYLAVTQSLIATGFQLIPSLGGLLMMRFTDTLALVGMTLSIGRVTGSIASYPAGKISDTLGRRIVLFLGLLLSGSGSLLIYFAVISKYLLSYILGLVTYGLGLGVLRQTTVAALDMYPSSRKAEGIGYVMTGTSLGSIGSPILVWATSTYATQHGMDDLAIPWLAPPLLMLIAGLFVYAIRPDPLEIARNLGDYYPGELFTKSKKILAQQSEKLSSLLTQIPQIIAITNGMLAFGVMIMIMSLSSVILRQQGISLTLISVAIGLHVIGMFGFSSIFGRIADNRGRKVLILIGSIILVISGLVTPLTTGYWPLTLGLFFVGFGWSAVNVGVTAMLGDNTPPTLMGRMIGINQLFAGVSGIIIPLLGGSIAQIYGFPAIGVASLVLSIPIIPITLKLKELTPGTYDHL
jgi:MFS family permease